MLERIGELFQVVYDIGLASEVVRCELDRTATLPTEVPDGDHVLEGDIKA